MYGKYLKIHEFEKKKWLDKEISSWESSHLQISLWYVYKQFEILLALCITGKVKITTNFWAIKVKLKLILGDEWENWSLV